MRALNVTFCHGHIYNSNTKERILIEEGVNYIIIHEKEQDIKKVDPDFRTVPRSDEAIIREITSDFEVTHLKKIANEGSHLYFFITQANENDDTKKQKSATFRITLLEDLYLYLKKSWKDYDIQAGGRLFDCDCMVDKSYDDYDKDLQFFEEVYAKSINSVRKKTHVHYFGNEGSPNANVFDKIFFGKQNSKHLLLDNVRGFTDDDKVENVLYRLSNQC